MPLRKRSKTLFKSEVACAGDVSKGVLRIKRASGKQMRLMGALIFSGALTFVSRPLPPNANPRPGSMISFVGLQAGSKKLREMTKNLPPIHPGEGLREEFLVPMKLSPLARGPCGRCAAHTDRAVWSMSRPRSPLRRRYGLPKRFGTTPAF